MVLPSSVWNIQRTFWLAWMPDARQLLGRIVRSSSNPGDLVIDPFAGSGTTLAVAKKLGRSYLGFELSADYVAHIRKRLASIKSGQALDGAPEPLKSVPSTPQGRPLKKPSRRR